MCEYHVGKFRIRVVDGPEVRKQHPDFINYGHHYLVSDIPEDEVWLDASANPEEIALFVLRAMYEVMLYDRGLPKETVSEAAEEFDRQIRSGCPEEDIHVRKLADFEDLSVWLVRGDQVRKQHDPNFIMGGHGYVYDYVPKNEVWIEEALPPLDKAFTLLHELYELSLMREGMTYDPAHERATEIEKKLRNRVPEGQP